MGQPPHATAQAFNVVGGGKRGRRGAAGSGPSEPESYGVRFWDELHDLQATDRLVKGLLGENSAAVIVGCPGTAKTFLALDLSLHVAIGWPWMDRAVLPSAVLYVAAEGQRGVMKRIAAFRRRHKVAGDVAPPPFTVIPAPVDLVTDGAGAGQVINAARYVSAKCGRPVGIVVIDTLARCFGGGNENAPEDMNKFLASVDLIRAETGAAVIIAHHAGKDQSRGMRGHSALLGAADTVIEVTGLDGIRTATVVKQKDGDAGVSIAFKLDVIEVGQNDDGSPITSCVVMPAHSAAKAKAAPKLPPEYREALAQLREVVADQGEVRPANGVPSWAVVVKIDAWREQLKRKGLIAPGESGRAWFYRAKARLLATGMIGELDGHVWIIQRP
ncbi:MAG: helicase RepA family protein [Dongiaceae bacterium]